MFEITFIPPFLVSCTISPPKIACIFSFSDVVFYYIMQSISQDFLISGVEPADGEIVQFQGKDGFMMVDGRVLSRFSRCSTCLIYRGTYMQSFKLIAWELVVPERRYHIGSRGWGGGGGGDHIFLPCIPIIKLFCVCILLTYRCVLATPPCSEAEHKPHKLNTKVPLLLYFLPKTHAWRLIQASLYAGMGSSLGFSGIPHKAMALICPQDKIYFSCTQK